jgi:hydrogenase maturation protein HypF
VRAPRPLLACGAELKSTFCVAKGARAWVSHHIGDLSNYETLESFRAGVEHLGRLFAVAPEVVAHDLHPDYLSTAFAREIPGVELVGVQHHHAHLAACLAEHGETGPAVGAIFDGSGYGTDGTVWGGELLVGGLEHAERAGHLRPVPLPGGDRAAREPWRMACSWLMEAQGGEPEPLAGVDGEAWRAVAHMVRTGVAAPSTTSAGRLFDAVAALVGLRDRVNYEGQAAIELEQRVDHAERGGYPARLDWPLIRGVDLVRAVVDDLAAGVDVGVVAARFHNGVVDVLARACAAGRVSTGLDTVALSGGVFQNMVLTQRLVTRLLADGFTVLTHHRVPPNDAGISLGQVAVAAAQDRARP